MPHPAHASGWPGRTRPATRRQPATAGKMVMIMTALMSLGLGGCALRPVVNTSAIDDLEFLGRAMDGNAATREAMWKEAAAAGHGTDASLRLALLQSVPDHSGYDPAAAQRNLRALLAQNPAEDVAALARVRLDELKLNSQCLGEAQDLRRRLTQVVDIERQIDSKRRP